MIALKINIALDDELVKRIDAFADENYMSRSGFLSFAAVNYLNAVEVKKYMRDMVLLLQKISDKEKLDHETIEELEDLKRVAKLLCGGFNA